MKKNETEKTLSLVSVSQLSNEILGTRLTQLREFYLQTQQAFADKIGVNRQTLADWEHGKYLVSIPCLLKIQNMYHISIDDFLNPSIPVEELCAHAKRDTELERMQKEWEAQKRNEQELLLKKQELLIKAQKNLENAQESYTNNFVTFAQVLIAAVLLISTTSPLVGIPLCIAYFLFRKRLGVQSWILDVIAVLCLAFDFHGSFVLLNSTLFHFGHGEATLIESRLNLQGLYNIF